MTAGRGNRVGRLSYETRLTLLCLASGLSAVVVVMLLVWGGDYSAKVQWTLTVLILGCWWGFAAAVQERIVRPLQTISNLLAALHEGDFSIRARGSRAGDALGEALAEVNALGRTLRDQRLGALEATALLRTVMAEIDVAVFTFDEQGRLKLVNRAGERLLDQPAERLLGRTAEELDLAERLEGESPRTLATTFPGGAGRWGVRVSSFREHGLPHQLLVVSDLTRALREEEIQAWKRLVRVLGHELNNSLAPIKSIAGSLKTLLGREPPAADWREDMKSGLAVIAGRAEALSRFMGAYARLARLRLPL